MIVGQVHGQTLHVIYPTVASGTVGYLEAIFDFVTDDWAGLVKWAHFKKDDIVYDVQLTDGRIGREEHLDLEAGVWEVYLHGNAIVDGQVVMRITTEKQKLLVKESGLLEGSPLPEIPLSAAEQIMATAQEALFVADSLRADAENGMFDGEKGEKGDCGAQGEKGDKGDKGDPGEVTLAYANSRFANTLSAEKSGAAVVLDDVSPNHRSLAVVSLIHPARAEGVPSFENPLPLSARSGMTLTVSDGTESRELSVSFGQDIYGGTLDWSTGVLTVDRALHVITEKDVWGENNTSTSVNGQDQRKRYTLNKYSNKWMENCRFLKSTFDNKLFCSVAPTIEGDYTYYQSEGIGTGVSGFYFYFEQYATDFEGFKQAMLGAEIVYAITNPVTVQLTPQQIEALGEVTTLQSDAGETSVTYSRDINKAFEELRQAIISLGGNV